MASNYGPFGIFRCIQLQIFNSLRQREEFFVKFQVRVEDTDKTGISANTACWNSDREALDFLHLRENFA